MNDDTLFVPFLIKAKLHAYAGSGALQRPSRPMSKDLHFSEGDLRYIDSYLGESSFIGEEAVWRRGAPLWGMNYYGRNLAEKIPEGFGEFLKKALRNIPEEGPFRGPRYFRDEEFEYFCQWDGRVDYLTGFAEIRQDGRRIYELHFHGGYVV